MDQSDSQKFKSAQASNSAQKSNPGAGISLREAFSQSMELAKRWDKAVDRTLDKAAPDVFLKSAWLDGMIIKANAIALTPIVWTAKKFGFGG